MRYLISLGDNESAEKPGCFYLLISVFMFEGNEDSIKMRGEGRGREGGGVGLNHSINTLSI